MRPPPANHQSGNDIFKLRQARAEHPATGSAGMPTARLVVRPPLKSHQSSIRATRTQLRTQNTMGTGGGISGAQPTVRYHFITFPFTLKDIALCSFSRIAGLSDLHRRGNPGGNRLWAQQETPRWNLFTIVVPALSICA